MRNRKNRCRGLAILLSAILALTILAGTAVAADEEEDDSSQIPLTNLIEGWPQMSEINELSGVVMDADTGAILYSLNRGDIRYPASTTKIMTALLTLEHASLDDIVTMTAEGLVHTTDGSTNAGTVGGEEFTVEQCLYMILLKSANDIAVQLGVHVAGSVGAFAEMMNARAAECGCTSTHFVNPSGMPDSDHYSTAEDMARIMRECLKNQTFREIIATPRYTVPPTNKNSSERVYDNHNQLIQPSSEYYYQYDIGGKTGYTQAAWRTFVTAGEKDGMTLIAVTMRGPDKTDFIDAKNLLEYGFNNFRHETIDGVTVTLPVGISADQTEETRVQQADGSWFVQRFYKKIPVGEAVLAAQEEAAGEADTAAISAVSLTDHQDQEVMETTQDAKEAGFHIPTGVLVALLVILLAAIAAVVVVLIRERKI